jgi:hypothetical protein
MFWQEDTTGRSAAGRISIFAEEHTHRKRLGSGAEVDELSLDERGKVLQRLRL